MKVIIQKHKLPTLTKIKILQNLKKHGILITTIPRIYICNTFILRFNAFSIPILGIFIKQSQKRNLQLIQHELIHWIQYKKEGFFRFTIGYIKEQLIHGYDLNKYEIEARINESDYCKTNYTQCVREGKANTVFNPKFRK